MDSAIVSEAWQAISILSDAQEHLARALEQCQEGAVGASVLQDDLNRADEFISHAKAHLITGHLLMRQEDQENFIKGTLVSTCTLDRTTEHEMLTPVCPLTVRDVALAYDEYVSGDLFTQPEPTSLSKWQDLSSENKQFVLGIAAGMVWVDGGQMNSNFYDPFYDRLKPLVEGDWGG